MRKFKLYEIVECRYIVESYDKGLIEVNSYDEFYDKIKGMMEEEKEDWLESMLCLYDNEEDLKENMVVGDFNNNIFSVCLGEEENMLCIEYKVELDSMKESEVIEIWDEFMVNALSN